MTRSRRHSSEERHCVAHPGCASDDGFDDGDDGSGCGGEYDDDSLSTQSPFDDLQLLVALQTVPLSEVVDLLVEAAEFIDGCGGGGGDDETARHDGSGRTMTLDAFVAFLQALVIRSRHLKGQVGCCGPGRVFEPCRVIPNVQSRPMFGMCKAVPVVKSGPWVTSLWVIGGNVCVLWR